jgi:hypothetical protein
VAAKPAGPVIDEESLKRGMVANPLATYVDLKRKHKEAAPRISMSQYNRELAPELKPYYKLESRPVAGKPLMYEKQPFKRGGRRTLRKRTLKKRRGGK